MCNSGPHSSWWDSSWWDSSWWDHHDEIHHDEIHHDEIAEWMNDRCVSHIGVASKRSPDSVGIAIKMPTFLCISYRMLCMNACPWPCTLNSSHSTRFIFCSELLHILLRIAPFCSALLYMYFCSTFPLIYSAFPWLYNVISFALHSTTARRHSQAARLRSHIIGIPISGIRRYHQDILGDIISWCRW